MELPFFLSLRRKYRRLFHWSVKKNYVTAASLNTSSYICLIRNLFPRIYCFSLLQFNHSQPCCCCCFVLCFLCVFFLFNTRQYCYFSTFSLCIIIFHYAYMSMSASLTYVAGTNPEALATLVTTHLFLTLFPRVLLQIKIPV